MSRVGLFVGLVSGLFICKLVGIGDQLKAGIGEWMDLAERRAQRLIALESESEALRKDAERYRWLRETEVWDDACDEISMKENIWIVESREEVINRTGDDLDRSIDFMMDKK